MSQENEYDIRDQRKILILEMSTNPGGEVVTQILLHSVIGLRVLQAELGNTGGRSTGGITAGIFSLLSTPPPVRFSIYLLLVPPV